MPFALFLIDDASTDEDPAEWRRPRRPSIRAT